MPSEPYDDMPDATAQPLEFALLALNLVDAEAFTVDDNADIEASVLQGGFSLQYSLGLHFEFALSHDEVTGQYTATISDTRPLGDAQTAVLALQLIHLMPQERRFSLDPTTLRLVLSETWSPDGLDIVQLAEGMRSLIDAMSAFASPPVPDTAAKEPLPSPSLLRV